MSESITIPADMIDAETTAATGSKAVVSVRDFLLLLGATDEQMAECDAHTARREADKPAALAVIQSAGAWRRRDERQAAAWARGRWYCFSTYEGQVSDGFDPATNRPVTSVGRLLELRAECEARWSPEARP